MSPNKPYQVSQSRLYRIGRKRDIASLLSVSPAELGLLRPDVNYKEWIKRQTGKKDRLIEEPLPNLRAALSKLQSVLSRVETPEWLMSGKKHVRSQDNATKHRLNSFAITIDIESFYQSTKREYIYSAFKSYFDQTDDVASLVADITTYKGHIPTGAPTSQLIAFWAYRQTFERIHGLCIAKGIIMTVWVDDIAFSSSKAFPKNWLTTIGKIAGKVGLKLKTKKTKVYSPADFKIFTGSAVSPSGDLQVRNTKRKEILKLVSGRSIEQLSLPESRQLLGKLTAQRQNEADFFERTHQRCLQRVRKLQKQMHKKKARKVQFVSALKP